MNTIARGLEHMETNFNNTFSFFLRFMCLNSTASLFVHWLVALSCRYVSLYDSEIRRNISPWISQISLLHYERFDILRNVTYTSWYAHCWVELADKYGDIMVPRLIMESRRIGYTITILIRYNGTTGSTECTVRFSLCIKNLCVSLMPKTVPRSPYL